MIELLKKYNIIPSEVTEDTMKRIRWVNQLRNSIVHSGEIKISGFEDKEKQLLSSAGLIVGQIVPAICTRVLGECFGFDLKGVGSLCMDTDNLTEFFLTGVWDGWKMETQDIDDWFYI